MHTSFFIHKSTVLGIYISLFALALFTVAGWVSLDHVSAVHAAKVLKLNISIDKDEIKRGNTQEITVTVSDNDNSDDKLSNANVKLVVYPPETDSTTAKDETDDAGEAKFNVKISDEAEYGTYEVNVKASKDGYDTQTEKSSFDVVGSPSKEDGDYDADDNNDHKNGVNSRDDGNDDGHGSDGKREDESGNDQASSQGNACGNGILSTNIICQNVVNQVQGDGNAISIIALQNRGNDESEDTVPVTNPSIPSSSTSSSSPSSYIPPSPLSSRLSPASVASHESTGQASSMWRNPGDSDSIASMVDQYVHARIKSAIDARLNHLR
jgi:hypothetical protein